MSSVSASVASLLGFSGALVSQSSPLLPASATLPSASPSHGASLLSASPRPTNSTANYSSLSRDRANATADGAIAGKDASFTQYNVAAKRGREVNLAEEDVSARRREKAARVENTSRVAVDAVNDSNRQYKIGSDNATDQKPLDTRGEATRSSNSYDKEKNAPRQQVPLKHASDIARSLSPVRLGALRRITSPGHSGLSDYRRTGTGLGENSRANRIPDSARYSPKPREIDGRGRSPQRPGNAKSERFDKYNTYDQYPLEDNGHRQWDEGRKQYGRPRSVSLGERGDTRFFMLKSFNEGNVRRAMVDGVWTTQLKNESMLVDAFKKCRNVVFFFSVNKSRAFQGYARMESLPSVNTIRPSWMDNIHWQTTEPFRIDWYNTATTDFRHIAHLVNDFNEHRSVIIGKDGQEIDDECGRRLPREMDITAEDEAVGTPVGRGRSEHFRGSPSLASRVAGGRP